MPPYHGLSESGYRVGYSSTTPSYYTFRNPIRHHHHTHSPVGRRFLWLPARHSISIVRTSSTRYVFLLDACCTLWAKPFPSVSLDSCLSPIPSPRCAIVYKPPAALSPGRHRTSPRPPFLPVRHGKSVGDLISRAKCSCYITQNAAWESPLRFPRRKHHRVKVLFCFPAPSSTFSCLSSRQSGRARLGVFSAYIFPVVLLPHNQRPTTLVPLRTHVSAEIH